MRWCVILSALTLSLAACGADADPDSFGYAVAPDGACHQWLIRQCDCCGDGEVNCRMRIDFNVKHKTAYTSVPEATCQERLDGASDDAAVFCALFETPAQMLVACQGFPPSPQPDVVADASPSEE